MSDATMATYVVGVLLGYLIGRCHGSYRHHMFLARGFGMLSAASKRDKQGRKTIYDFTTRPVDVSNAFGKQEPIDDVVLADDFMTGRSA